MEQGKVSSSGCGTGRTSEPGEKGIRAGQYRDHE